MARHPRDTMFVEIAVGIAILAFALFAILELARVAGMMQLDRIFSYGQNDRQPAIHRAAMPIRITGLLFMAALRRDFDHDFNGLWARNASAVPVRPNISSPPAATRCHTT